MTVQIPPELEQYIDEKIASGEFESQQAFMAEVTRLYRDLEARHAELRASIDHARAQLDRGESVDLHGDAELHDFFEDLKARGRAQLNRSEPANG